MVDKWAQLTGRPCIPPLWAFGFQQSKWGYETQAITEHVIKKFDALKIPMDVIWLDQNHLKGQGPWEWNLSSFPDPKRMADLLWEKKRHVVRTCDCHLPTWPDHIQYQEAKKNGFLIKNVNGSDWEAVCWPGRSSWPDLWNTRVMEWLATWHYYGRGIDITTPNMWFWNDMNEISSEQAFETTVPKDGRIMDGYEVREVHSLYGLSQVAATYKGLQKRDELAGLPRQRPWVLSRAWFAGSAKYTWVWTGDNSCRWNHLANSIAMTTVAGLTGMPFIGEDLGGFKQSVGPEMMARWCQLGAWIYPFYRNHCSDTSAWREPWEFVNETYTQIINAINDRYMLLGVWYTHSIYTLKNGRSPVVPLWYEWPEVDAFHDNAREVLLGDAFLVVPVVDQGAKSVTIAKPPGVWYDLWQGKTVEDGEVVNVTMFDTPVYLRGGRIVPLYRTPGDGATATIVTPLTLVVAGSEGAEAEGSIYLDDGIGFAYENGEFIHRRFALKNGVLSASRLSPLEKKAPAFLRDCLIENLTYYQIMPDKSVHVSHLHVNLKLVDEWSMNLTQGDGYVVLGSKNKEEGGLGYVFVAIGLVIVAMAVVVGVIVVYRKRGGRGEIVSVREARRYV
jgi:alpha 1,3-glucosidase